MTSSSTIPYRVLARKYRPAHFDELIGQDALVRTLCNAIESGRIAHAFMLTGVRGVGKTTTARIIAKALNYTGADGTAGPTTGPTDDCAICQAIGEDRHPDIMEMDAASRTGVDDIREILDGVRYAPTSARYKIYIIDEVHMLSKAAFNALLKTLEEPPEHVKFIFATTEIRKVPVTVLSRCQRFDLRRVDTDVLKTHFQNICGKEEVTFEGPAIDMIASASDGSVRDGLSLLDQAIALGQGHVLEEDVNRMLGLSDRSQVFSLFASCMSGQVNEALAVMDRIHKAGGDPLVVLQDLLEIAHGLTLVKAMDVREEAFKRTSLPYAEVERAKSLARDLNMPVLQRAWGILLKGMQEAHASPDTKRAVEMVIMRLIYAADLPDPAKLIRTLQKGGTLEASAGAGAQQQEAGKVLHAPQMEGGAPVMKLMAGGGAQVIQALEPQSQTDTNVEPNNFKALVTLFEDKGEMILASEMTRYMHLVRYEVGRLEFRPHEDAPANLATRIGACLKNWTDTRWVVSVSSDAGEKTLADQEKEEAQKLEESVLASPDVSNVMRIFPGTKLKNIIEDEDKG